jgi:Flp pilus assembly pilin Flp
MFQPRPTTGDDMTARIRALAREFVRAEEGATMVEYALLAVLISMVVAIAALTLG